MGYTHYWYRPLSIEPKIFGAICEDFSRIVLALDDLGVKLANGRGEGAPEITPDQIWFNGVEKCGHAQNEAVSIPWPAPKAAGVNADREPIAGQWFAGAFLSTRACNGDCSYESVDFPREMDRSGYLQKNAADPGLYFTCCKTAYRPYDLAVTALLIIAKHHMGNDIIVSSDGEDENWLEGKQVCQAFLDYGLDYGLTGPEFTLVRKGEPR